MIDAAEESLKPTSKKNYQGTPPTLVNLYEELLRQPEEEARKIALELELITVGSLNTFAQQTNVDIHNRIICYDIKELGSQLYGLGMLVVLDSIFNQITRNRVKRKTHIHCYRRAAYPVPAGILRSVYQKSLETCSQIWRALHRG